MCRACAESERAALLCAEQIPDYLARLPLFRRLGRDEIAHLAKAARIRQLVDGEWLFRRGESADRLFVVREGQMALFRQSRDGRESIVAVVGVDEVFGEEQVVLDQAERDMHARSIGDCALLFWSSRQLRELLETSPQLARSLLQTAHRRQRVLLDQIERLSLEDACGRLVSFLLSEVGEAVGSRRIRLPLPKHTLAAHLAIQPETLSRTLARLKARGLIEEHGDSLLLDVDRLRAGRLCECHDRSWGCPGPLLSKRVRHPGEAQL